MGNVFAEITLKNAVDIGFVNEGRIAEDNVRAVTLTAIVDTGATTMVINEDIFNKLGLSVVETRKINLAGGAKMEGKVTSPVSIQWKDRQVMINAMMLPEGRPLLGLLPLEFMDLMVDPVRQELVGAHGDEPYLMAM
ncbi:MAG: aspartyl protease family protein [Treponema sp.]|jgi:clan AA aspartic protease|nr:aspartyl protease family protein [Treponema sp.]